MWLYTILLISTISVPLALSFERKLQFYRQWKYVLPAIAVVALFYIAFDLFFTVSGIWGFNPKHHLPVALLHLPLEEWLFFIIVPYACIFLHEVFILYFPGLRLPDKVGRWLSILFILALFVVILLNTGKTYTVYSGGLVILALILALLDKTNVINSYFLSFLLMLVPFLIVNAILTGSFTVEEVVWYNNAENLGIRVFTIPPEDFGYAFSLVLFNILLKNKLKERMAG